MSRNIDSYQFKLSASGSSAFQSNIENLISPEARNATIIRSFNNTMSSMSALPQNLDSPNKTNSNSLSSSKVFSPIGNMTTNQSAIPSSSTASSSSNLYCSLLSSTNKIAREQPPQTQGKNNILTSIPLYSPISLGMNKTSQPSNVGISSVEKQNHPHNGITSQTTNQNIANQNSLPSEPNQIPSSSPQISSTSLQSPSKVIAYRKKSSQNSSNQGTINPSMLSWMNISSPSEGSSNEIESVESSPKLKGVSSLMMSSLASEKQMPLQSNLELDVNRNSKVGNNEIINSSKKNSREIVYPLHHPTRGVTKVNEKNDFVQQINFFRNKQFSSTSNLEDSIFLNNDDIQTAASSRAIHENDPSSNLFEPHHNEDIFVVNLISKLHYLNHQNIDDQSTPDHPKQLNDIIFSESDKKKSTQKVPEESEASFKKNIPNRNVGEHSPLRLNASECRQLRKNESGDYFKKNIFGDETDDDDDESKNHVSTLEGDTNFIRKNVRNQTMGQLNNQPLKINKPESTQSPVKKNTCMNPSAQTRNQILENYHKNFKTTKDIKQIPDKQTNTTTLLLNTQSNSDWEPLEYSYQSRKNALTLGQNQTIPNQKEVTKQTTTTTTTKKDSEFLKNQSSHLPTHFRSSSQSPASLKFIRCESLKTETPSFERTFAPPHQDLDFTKSKPSQLSADTRENHHQSPLSKISHRFRSSKSQLVNECNRQ